MNTELTNVCEWFTCNRLSLNLKKTHAMVFTNRSVDKNVNIRLNNIVIEQVNSCTFLGVVIDDKLTWKNHCQKVLTLISRNLGIIRKLKHYVPSHILLSIYNTLSLSCLQYCILAWGNTHKTFLDKLFVVQKKSLRLINGSGSRDHSAPLFVKFNTLSVFDLYKYHMCALMYNFEKTVSLPLNIRDLFVRNTDIHTYNTRASDKLHLSKVRTSLHLSTVRYQGPLLWNQIRSSCPLTSIRVCKKYFKKQLLLNTVNDN